MRGQNSHPSGARGGSQEVECSVAHSLPPTTLAGCGFITSSSLETQREIRWSLQPSLHRLLEQQMDKLVPRGATVLPSAARSLIMLEMGSLHQGVCSWLRLVEAEFARFIGQSPDHSFYVATLVLPGDNGGGGHGGP